MTIQRAREIMGDDIKDLSDKEVGAFIKRSVDMCSVCSSSHTYRTHRKR